MLGDVLALRLLVPLDSNPVQYQNVSFLSLGSAHNKPVLDGIDAALLLSFIDFTIRLLEPLLSISAELGGVGRHQQAVCCIIFRFLFLENESLEGFFIIDSRRFILSELLLCLAVICELVVERNCGARQMPP